MSGLAPVFRRLVKAASHPNSLLYAVQLEQARVKYLVKGELGDGKEDAMALEAPREKSDEMKDGEQARKEGEKVEGKAEGGIEEQRGEDEPSSRDSEGKNV